VSDKWTNIAFPNKSNIPRKLRSHFSSNCWCWPLWRSCYCL